MHRSMTIAFHVGAPHTDEDQLTWSLRKDVRVLSDNKVLLRRPNTYRKFVKGMIRKLDGYPADPVEEEYFLSKIVKGQNIDRLILSDPSLLGAPAWVLNKGHLYQNAGPNTASLRNILPNNPVEFFLAIRNPATFLPDVFNSQMEKNYSAFFGDTDFLSLRWSGVVRDIRVANPGCKIFVWCSEETPLIWPTILEKVTNLAPPIYFKGSLDIVNSILTDEGAGRLAKYLSDHPEFSESQLRNAQMAFLEKYVDASTIESIIDLPGWSQDLIEAMSIVYEDDISLIEEMPGVEFLST